MRRRLLNLLTLLSLLLCAGVLVLWVRSYFVGDEWNVRRTRMAEPVVDEYLTLETSDGGFQFDYRWQQITQGRTGYDPGIDFRHWNFQRGGHRPLSEQLWFDTQSAQEQPFRGDFAAGTMAHQSVTVPAWFLVLIFGVGPVLKAGRGLRKQRLERQRDSLGLCVQCGYDLRGASRRCPECGTFKKRRMWRWVSET